jgi:periplasmic divalent cation tolerance protein
MRLVYITCRDEKEAEFISNTLIEKKIAACTNIFPVKSIFMWKGKLQKQREAVVIAKTKEKFNRIKKEVENIHSYEVPCIISFTVDSNKKFLNWVNQQ